MGVEWPLAVAVCGLVAGLGLVLAALLRAHGIGRDGGAALLVEREARHVAEREVAARLLVESQGRVAALEADAAAEEAEDDARDHVVDRAMDATAALDRAGRPAGPHGAPDVGLLLDAAAPAPSGDRARPGPAPAGHAAGPLVARSGDGAGVAPGSAGAAG